MPRRLRLRGAFVPCAVLVALAPATVAAQSIHSSDGPEAAAVITRDATGGVTLRAVRTLTPIKVDGRLDEEMYVTVPAMSDFVQTEPTDGAQATEKTDIWFFYDKDNIYLAARCWETHPERVVANEMRRDVNNVYTSNDNIVFGIDTFDDQRSGVVFVIDSVGGRNDGQFTDSKTTLDWNPVWSVKTGKFEGGWTVEVAIPFKVLRYRAGAEQVWGFNAARLSRWKNEISYLKRVPAGKGQGAITQANLFARVVGIEVPPASRTFEVKPYALSTVTTDMTARPSVRHEPGGNGGVDVKYGVTRNLTADFTVRTDFAQVEADEQQVNLTRFNLIFPEKRDFFLENQGVFTFGSIQAPTTGQLAVGDAPLLFYSRRIGLNNGRAVPIDAGGRLTGRAGRFTIGMVNIQSGDDASSGSPATNFSVMRLKRDVLRRSSIGAIYTGRTNAQLGAGRNDAYGVDGVFGFFDNLTMSTYWAQTAQQGFRSDNTSYDGRLDYTGDRYGVSLEQLMVGAHFNPEVGFARRTDIRKSYALARFSPRPKNKRSRVRKYTYQAAGTYIENGNGRVDMRILDSLVAIDFQKGDRVSAGYTGNYEFIPSPFLIATNVTVPVGGYSYQTGHLAYNFGQQRGIFGNVTLDAGTFYNGRKTSIGVSTARVEVTRQLSIEPNISINAVDLPQGSFTSKLLGTRATFTVTPTMFVSALIQFNSSTASLGSNIRFRWEYQPGSEIFVVYNDQRDTTAQGFPALQSRSFVVKANRFFRF